MFSTVSRASVPVFMLCALGLIFDGSEGVGSRFHALRSQTHFRRYRGRRMLFSCFAQPNSFSAVQWASAPVFMFCARSRTRFRRYGGRRVPFSCFALPDSFSAVPKASCPVFMFRAPGHVFVSMEGVGSRFSCFALPDSFSAVPSASGAIFMF
jgi:hypothetical protein